MEYGLWRRFTWLKVILIILFFRGLFLIILPHLGVTIHTTKSCRVCVCVRVLATVCVVCCLWSCVCVCVCTCVRTTAGLRTDIFAAYIHVITYTQYRKVTRFDLIWFALLWFPLSYGRLWFWSGLILIEQYFDVEWVGYFSNRVCTKSLYIDLFYLLIIFVYF